jgi:hypothetical protein
MCRGIVSSPADKARPVSACASEVADIRDALVVALAHACDAVDVKLRALDPDLSGGRDDNGLQDALVRRKLRCSRDELEDLGRDVLGVDRSVDAPPWLPEPGSPEASERLRLATVAEETQAGDEKARVGWRLGWWRHQARAARTDLGLRVRPGRAPLRVRPQPRGLRPAPRRAAGRRTAARARSPGRLDGDPPEPPLARRDARSCRAVVAVSGGVLEGAG